MIASPDPRPESSKRSLSRRIVVAGIAVLAAGGAALARPVVGGAPNAQAAGTAFEVRANVNLLSVVSPVTLKIPIPAGKRLDIERVTMTGSIQSGQSGQAPVFVAVLTTTVNGQKGDFPLGQPQLVPFLAGIRPINLLLNEPMFGAFADGGANSPVVTINRTNLSSLGFISVTLSGRLE